MRAWPAWRVNPSGARRSLEEALDIAERAGVDVGAVRVRLDQDLLEEDLPLAAQHCLGRYMPNLLAGSETEFVWSDHVAEDGSPIVRLNPIVLDSDEAIVWVLAHEVWETSLLEQAFARNGGRMMARALRALIDEVGGTLHDQAWVHADQVLARLRTTGSP